jgi:Pre-mRNA splicing Prp18-interacting factor
MKITVRNLRIREDTPKYLRNLALDRCTAGTYSFLRFHSSSVVSVVMSPSMSYQLTCRYSGILGYYLVPTWLILSYDWYMPHSVVVPQGHLVFSCLPNFSIPLLLSLIVPPFHHPPNHSLTVFLHPLITFSPPLPCPAPSLLLSAHYDPKARSMRANPFPNENPEDLAFAGDNFIRHTGAPRRNMQLQSTLLLFAISFLLPRKCARYLCSCECVLSYVCQIDSSYVTFAFTVCGRVSTLSSPVLSSLPILHGRAI